VKPLSLTTTVRFDPSVRRPSARSRLLVTAILLVLPATAAAPSYSSEAIEAGYRDFNFAGGSVTSEPTEAKPESKLWHHDDSWWGILWDPIVRSYRVHRFDTNLGAWTSVGPDLDTRGKSSADVLWDGAALYVSSRAKESHRGVDEATTLSRFHYDSTSKEYLLDAGFPAEIVGTTKTPALTIAKDSRGELWAAWTTGGQVLINRSSDGGLSWGAALPLPTQGNLLDAEDIASIIAMGNDHVGVLWGNQIDEKYYFSAHRDGDADTAWELREEALADDAYTNVADDHINLAATSDGTLVGALKTGIGGMANPLVFVVKRDAATGSWSRHLLGLVVDDHTRPIVIVDSEANRAHVLARSIANNGIFHKSADLDRLQFAPGPGTPFIQSITEPKLNNPTSTKQAVGSQTGLLVLASDKTSKFYFHEFVELEEPPGDLLVDAHFDSNAEEFVYADDGFRGTSEPTYASGGWTGGALQVILGGIDDNQILGMSGGWTESFPLDSSDEVTVSFRYRLTLAAGYETDEYGEVLVTLDAAPLGTGGFDYVARLSGDGNGGSPQTTGWQTFTTSLGPLSAGLHTLTIGGYNNKKTFNDETTEILVDDVQVRFLTSHSNTPPVAIHDAYGVDEDDTLVVSAPGLLSNDFDADGDPLTAAVAGAPLGGVLALNADGSFTYVPTANFHGTDSFSYFLDDGKDASIATVNITVRPLDDPPVAMDDSYHVDLDSTVEVAAPGVLANDVEFDGEALSAELASAPSNGDLVLHPDGSFSYSPGPGFDGSDTFSYRASDGTTSSDLAVVTINGSILADFDSDTNGFVYRADTFRGTSEPIYAIGTRLDAGGYSGGALAVILGGQDEETVLGMSGGWSRSFTVTGATLTALSFRFQLTQTANYEADEFSEALVAVDDVLVGTNGEDVIARITGDGQGGSAQTTGWTLVEMDLRVLDAGTHTITVGGYNNKKTWSDEWTEILVDDVLIEFLAIATTGAPTTGPLGQPGRIALAPNYPNPFHPRTTIEYALPAAADVRLLVYNVQGRVVRRLVDERQPSGHKKVVWQGRDDAGRAVASGVYFLRLDAGDRQLTRKMILRR
jgi:hypothetical protein